MNFCTKCESYYQQPGTCNCFAAVKPFLWPFEVNPTPTVPGDYTGDPPPAPPYKITCGSAPTSAHWPSPYEFPNTCGTVRYDPTVPFTYTDENSLEPVN